jgi:hypothetical protein
MGLAKGFLKGAVAMKIVEIARREAAKPENQRKAKELFAKVANRKRTR